MQPANKERPYLPQAKFRRELSCIKDRSQHKLKALNTTLTKSKAVSMRMAEILKVENNNQTHLSLIHKYLLVKAKYKLNDSFTKDQLSEPDIQTLMVDIKNKECHQRLFKVCEHELADVKQSETWLTCENIKPRDEVSYCFLQDRNIFFRKTAICPHCRAASRTVDH